MMVDNSEKDKVVGKCPLCIKVIRESESYEYWNTKIKEEIETYKVHTECKAKEIKRRSEKKK